MPVRMKDIARDLGVSVVTVSKAVRNHDDISSATRARVLKRMQELNYQPNLAARALVTGKSFMVGLVVPDLVHPFFAEVAKGLSKILREKSYSLVIASAEDDPALEKEEIDQMLARRLDALLVASSQVGTESFTRIEESETPYILLDRRISELQANFVGIDDVLAGKLATNHLAEVGCRRIAHIGGRSGVSTPADRLAGYQEALEQHGMPFNPEDVEYAIRLDDSGDRTGYEAMKNLLARPVQPDGVFCYNDTTALGAMRAILEAGLRIPQDIAVVGCGNVFYSDLLRVPLTTIDQSSKSMGEAAAALALRVIESRGRGVPESILIEPKLVKRESTKRF